MGWDRAEHMALLERDIQKWEAQAVAFETNGKADKVKEVRKWIKSAKHVVELLKGLPHA